MVGDNGQAGTEIEVTPEMVKAGALELRSRTYGERLEEVVIDVFLAMALEGGSR